MGQSSILNRSPGECQRQGSASDSSGNTPERSLRVCKHQLTSRISWTSQAVSNVPSFSWAVPSTLSVLNSPLYGEV